MFTIGDKVTYEGYHTGVVIAEPTVFNGETLVRIESDNYHNKMWFAVELVRHITD